MASPLEKLRAYEDARALHLAEEAIREDIETERRFLNYQEREYEARKTALLEREAGIKDAAIARIASARAAVLHDANVRLADKIARYHISGDVEHAVPTPEAVQEALDYWSCSDDVFRLCLATTERPTSDVALVRIYQEAIRSTEKSGRKAAHEAAIAKMVQQLEDAEYAERVAQQERLEA